MVLPNEIKVPQAVVFDQETEKKDQTGTQARELRPWKVFMDNGILAKKIKRILDTFCENSKNF